MTKRNIAWVCAALSLMFLFISIGHAALSDPLSMIGTAEVEIPSGLFITNITPKGSSGVDVNTATFFDYSTTIELSISKSSNGTEGSVSYDVTVFNNTKREYAYRAIYFQPNLEKYNNDIVNTSNARSSLTVTTNFPNGNKVAPGASLTFTVTYTLGRSTTLAARNTYKTLLNYQFGINVDSEPEAVEVVHDKFLDILNTKTTYDELVAAIDNKYDGYNEWTSNYIGNVTDATNDDSVAVNDLFAGHLQLVIDGETKPATVLIKHENLDGDTSTGDDYVAYPSGNGSPFYGYGCEMTLYLTTDDLVKTWNKSNAPVYVTVFTCDRDENGDISGDWYRIGEVYAGVAPIVTYDGNSGNGSFVTDDWVSTAATYQITDHYSYRVGEGDTIKNLVQVVDPAAIAELQRLLDIGKAMIDDTTYAGTGITVIEDAFERASDFFTLDPNGNPVANVDARRAFLVPIIEDLDRTITSAQIKIDEMLGNNS